LILLSACSSQSNYKVLSTIFDGVPDPESINQKSIDSSKKINPKTDLKDAEIQISTNSVHKPFGERACDKCHSGSGISRLNKQVTELCFDCHKNLFTNNLFMHGPAASGYCTECHVPHNSKFTKLLIKDNNELCYECHSKENINSNNAHVSKENTKCWQCHNPHAEKNKFMLKQIN
jgi:predicted CXXCH cytochrome family protein